MSLINKVLRDLERQHTDDTRARRSPLVESEIRPVRPVRRVLPPRPQLIRLGLVLVLVVATAFAWIQWGGALRKAISKPAPVVQAPPPPEKTASAPAAPEPKPTPPAVPPKVEPLTSPAKPEAPKAEIAKAETPKLPGPPLKPAPATPAPLPSVTDVVVRKQRDAVKPDVPSIPIVPKTPEKTVTAKVDAPSVSKPEASEPDVTPTEPAGETEPRPKPLAKSVLEKKLKPLTAEQRAESEYRLAALALQQKRGGEAESRLRIALAAQPSHLKARELLAGLLLQNGRWRDAQAQLEQGIALHPLHHPFAQLLARVYVDHDQEKKALELLEKNRAAGSGDADYLALLATLEQRAGRQDDAARDFQQALALRPQEGRWWLGLAISLEATGKWKESAEAYQRAAASGNLDRKLLQYTQQRLVVVRNRI